MATSDYDFTTTRNDLVRRALKKVGALSEGDPLSGEMLNDAIATLNEIVKHWQGSHVHLWTVRQLSTTLITADAAYALSSDPQIIGVDKVFLREATNSDMPLEKLSWRQYQDIRDKESTGTPVSYAIDNQPSPTMYIWPTPDSSNNGKTLYYLGTVKLKDFDSASGAGDFPTRWLKALQYALVVELADDYGVPLAERKHFVNMADKYFREARRGENDGSDNDFIGSAYKS